MAVGETAQLNEAANSQALHPEWTLRHLRTGWSAAPPAEWTAEQEEERRGSIKALHEAAAAHEMETAEQLADHWAEQAGFRVLSI